MEDELKDDFSTWVQINAEEQRFKELAFVKGLD